MNEKGFLVKYLKISGWLEMGFGIIFLLIDPLLKLLEVPNSIFFSSASGVMIFFLGFLLWYSARDISKYLIIPIISCIFRYVMAIYVEVLGIITISILSPIFLIALIYDILSATLTLFLLKKNKLV